MLSTYRWNGTLIIVSPTSPRLFKFQFTWTAVAVLALSCLVSFCLIVAIGYTFPPLVTNQEFLRLEHENQELRTGNMNASFRTTKVEDQVSRLDQQTQRIVELAQVD